MTLIKFEPLRDFMNLGDRVHRFFGEFPSNFDFNNSFSPKIDISEDEKSYEIHVAVPGMKKSDFKIDLADGKLTISGERKLEEKKEGKNVLCFHVSLLKIVGCEATARSREDNQGFSFSINICANRPAYGWRGACIMFWSC